MTETIYTGLIALSITLSVVFFLMGLRQFPREMSADDREFMDPLPKALRILWPMIRVFAYYIGARLSIDYLQSQQSKLQRAGLDYMLTAEQFVGLQATAAVLSFATAVGSTVVLMELNLLISLAAAVGGGIYPLVWLRDVRARRVSIVQKSLPVFVDYIRMAVEAGLNLSGGITQAVNNGPKGPLRQEFARVLRDVRSGLPRADALQAMADRLNLDGVYSLTGSIIQAERIGASLSHILRLAAEQRRIERFQRAEKLAMEAPVKLIGPLALFIFPATFIVLGFPIVMKFIGQGIM